MALGIDSEGHRRVLGFEIVPSEGAKVWKDFIGGLKERGLGGVRLFVTDGLNGMPEAIAQSFPDAEHQRCLVHMARNIANWVGVRRRTEALENFAAVYRSRSRDEAEKALDDFVGKWGRPFPRIGKLLSSKEEILCFLKFPEPLRKAIYTSNAIEGFNSKLKRDMRKRISLNSLNNADITISAVCMSYNSHCSRKLARGLAGLTSEERTKFGFEF